MKAPYQDHADARESPEFTCPAGFFGRRGSMASAIERAEPAEAILERLRADPVHVDGQQRSVSVTIGAATAAAGGEGRKLFEAADRALYAGKRAGRGQGRTADA
jgi:predicted signal transduction protein with EAL and GGDEF domain